MLNIRAIRKFTSLISDVKKTFSYLWLAFIKTLILQHFNFESHIWIDTNASNYAINRVLSQLNLNFKALSNDLTKSDFSQ